MRKLSIAITLVGATPIVLTGYVNNFSSFSITSDSTNNTIIPESIIIEGPNTVYLGCGTYTYSIKVQPEEAERNVEWTSSDSSILAINSIGQAQPQKVGHVTITAVSKYSPDVVDTIEVTVSDAPVPTAINIDGPSQVYFHKEPSFHYSILTEPTIAKTDVYWSVNDTEVATIKQNGNLTPKKVGVVTIHAVSMYDPLVSNDLQVEIKPEPPKSLTIIGDDAVQPGSFTQYTVETDRPDVCADVIWTSSDESRLIIDKNGNASVGFDEGYVEITAQSIADPSITATKIISIDNDIVYIRFSPTIGTGYDHFSPTYTTPGESFQVSFRSRVYQDDETWFVIHKELKPTDIEVIVNGENIMNQCTLDHNILTVPVDSSLEIGSSVTINVLGAEISDWVSWDDIAKITKKDYDDLGRPGKHYAAQYFQVGDYKKGYINNKLCGEFIIVDEYHDIYEVEESSEIVEVPIALTFMPKTMHISPSVANAFPKSRWEDGPKNDDELLQYNFWTTKHYSLEIEDEETHEVIIKNYLRKNLVNYKMDGLSSTSVKAPRKIISAGPKFVPYIENDLFWAPSFDEVYDPRVTNCAFTTWFHKCLDWGEDGRFDYFDRQEGSLYAYFDQDKYHFHNDGHIRVPDPVNRQYDDGYVDTQIMLRTTWSEHPFDDDDGNRSDYWGCPKRGFCLLTWLDPDANSLKDLEVRYPSTFDAKPANMEYTYSASFCI